MDNNESFARDLIFFAATLFVVAELVLPLWMAM